MAVQHFVWFPAARTSGLAPILTIGVGLVYAAAGAVTGPQLVDPTRTRGLPQAGMVGACTSLIALALFTLFFTLYLFATDNRTPEPLTYIALPVLIAVFAFLGDGWVLFLISIGVGLGVHWIVARRESA